MRTNVAAAVRLMLVTDDHFVAGRDLLMLARAAVRGGVTSVQLRLKEASPRQLVEAARALVAAVPVPVIVNDRPDVAVAAGAAGVHLGPGDVPPRLARRVLPPGSIVGASVGTDADVLIAGDADYWGIGPWGATATKSDAGSALGATRFAALVRAAGGRPCIAVGGVVPADLPLILESGGTGAAVVSGILGAADVEQAARRYARALERPA